MGAFASGFAWQVPGRSWASKVWKLRLKGASPLKGKRWERLPASPYENWVMGVDLGQSADYTAISVLCHSRTPLDDWDVNEAAGKIRQKVDEKFDVRGLQRLPLGMPYPEQVSRVQHLLAGPPLRGRCDLVLDQTGCGAPVADLFDQRGLKPARITITAGAEPTRLGHRRYGVPKSLLVSNVDARLNTQELRFAQDLTEAETLKDELQNFQRHVSSAGRSIFEARSGRHEIRSDGADRCRCRSDASRNSFCAVADVRRRAPQSSCQCHSQRG
jgi:hypothetical protein